MFFEIENYVLSNSLRFFSFVTRLKRISSILSSSIIFSIITLSFAIQILIDPVFERILLAKTPIFGLLPIPILVFTGFLISFLKNLTHLRPQPRTFLISRPRPWIIIRIRLLRMWYRMIEMTIGWYFLRFYTSLSLILLFILFVCLWLLMLVMIIMLF